MALLRAGWRSPRRRRRRCACSRTRNGGAGAGARRPAGRRRSATTALQDAHQVQARPSLIARARNADLLVCTGAELEIGWLPVLLQESGNAACSRGSRATSPRPTSCASSRCRLRSTARRATCIAAATRTSRPIRATSRRWRRAGARLRSRSAACRRTRSGRQDFEQRWQQAIARWTAQAAPLRGVPVVIAAQGVPVVSLPLARPERGRRSSPSRASSRALASAAVLATLKATPRGWCCTRPTRIRARRTGSRNAGIPRSSCRSRSAAAPREGPVRACSTTRWSACWRGAAK